MIKTKNFNLKQDPKLACTCGDARCDRRAIHQEVLEKLQCIRDDLGAPIVVTSGGRCPFHTQERGRDKSDHQLGFAVDVSCTDDLIRTKLLVLAGRHGATRVAYGKTFIHIAWTPTQRKDVPTWSYE